MKSISEILSDSRIWNVNEFIPGAYRGMLKLTDCGGCTVMFSDSEGGYEHVSIAPVRQFRIPSWDDMAELKGMFFEDEEEAYQIMPKKSQYVNIKENCLHLWRPKNGKTLEDLVRA